jgi:Protein of unknown function (DUF3891)
MIVTRRDGALSLVDQVEHGRIAGGLARHWGNTPFAVPTPHNAVCTAATGHDEGWRAVRHHPFGSPIQLTVGVSAPRTLTVDPYPFGAADFEIEIEHLVIPDRPYARTEISHIVQRTSAEEIRRRIQLGSSHE